MNKYILCYTESDFDTSINDTVTSCYTEKFDADDFIKAVERYTVMCGAYKHAVVLADIETGQILKQFGCAPQGKAVSV
ncbi:MAG: hypothetical protein K2G88_07070 [Oscillospiraceae bacterium]|nr:hypothetical protein [Oscillospiraceae bacterium]